jgi:hypothetical protein
MRRSKREEQRQGEQGDREQRWENREDRARTGRQEGDGEEQCCLGSSGPRQ